MYFLLKVFNKYKYIQIHADILVFEKSCIISWHHVSTVVTDLIDCAWDFC